jgi:hypothetical protein
VNINPIEVLAVAVNLAPELDSTNINVDPIEPGSKNASHAPAKTPDQRHDTRWLSGSF